MKKEDAREKEGGQGGQGEVNVDRKEKKYI